MKQRFIYISAAVVLVLGLLLFASTPPEKVYTEEDTASQSVQPMDPLLVIDSLKSNLSSSQQATYDALQQQMNDAANDDQKVAALNHLADFWKDTVGAFVPYAYYLSEAAKLDNSEKSLTFAAKFIFENMRRENRMDLKLWEADAAADLYKQALKLNPDDADLKIGLGSCYVYGPGMAGNAQQAMFGIQKLLEVEKADSHNMKAQLVLGIASVISNQPEKGVERLKRVVDFDPHNLEAISWLGDAYASTGDVANATKWYERSKEIVNDPAFSAEIDKRIQSLKQGQ